MGIRVLLCDDHELVRRGVSMLIEDATDIAIAGEAGNADEVVIQAVQLNPDVVVMDVRLPGRSGISRAREPPHLVPAAPGHQAGRSTREPHRPAGALRKDGLPRHGWKRPGWRASRAAQPRFRTGRSPA